MGCSNSNILNENKVNLSVVIKELNIEYEKRDTLNNLFKKGKLNPNLVHDILTIKNENEIIKFYEKYEIFMKELNLDHYLLQKALNDYNAKKKFPFEDIILYKINISTYIRDTLSKSIPNQSEDLKRVISSFEKENIMNVIYWNGPELEKKYKDSYIDMLITLKGIDKNKNSYNHNNISVFIITFAADDLRSFINIEKFGYLIKLLNPKHIILLLKPIGSNYNKEINFIFSCKSIETLLTEISLLNNLNSFFLIGCQNVNYGFDEETIENIIKIRMSNTINYLGIIRIDQSVNLNERLMNGIFIKERPLLGFFYESGIRTDKIYKKVLNNLIANEGHISVFILFGLDMCEEEDINDWKETFYDKKYNNYDVILWTCSIIYHDDLI